MSEATVLTPNTDNQAAQQQDVSQEVSPVPEATKLTPTVPSAAGKPSDWRAALDPEYWSEKSLENIKGSTPEEALPMLAKGYVSAQKMVGGSIKLPGKDAKPEDVSALRAKLAEAGVIDAVPDAPEKYTAKVNAPAGMPVNDAAVARFRQVAHENGVSDKAAQAMLDLYVEQHQEAVVKLGGSAKETMAALQKEWGGATQQYIGLAQRAVSDLGGTELVGVLDSTGLGNHPALIKAFAKVGKIMAEDDPVFASTVHVGGDDAKAEITAIMNDPNDLYHHKHKGKPGHTERVAYVQRLYERAYPPAV